MRTCGISKIGITVLISIYSASLVEVASAGRRRNRKLIRNVGELQEENYISSREHDHRISRNLGVGLDNLKYESSESRYHIQTTRGKDNKGQGKGTNYSDNLMGKGKGSSPNYGKGSVSSYGKGNASSYGKGNGKGSSSIGTMESEDTPYFSATESPSSIPTTLLENNIPTNQKKEHWNSKKGKHSKLRKSDKGLSTYHPIPHPTRTPTADQHAPSPSYTPTDEPNPIPTSATGDILVSLTPYTILYQVADNKRPPFRSELLEVIELTRIHLDQYFSSRYEGSELTMLSEVKTIFTKTAFELEEPTIDYESKAILKPTTVILPEKEDLDSILLSAFEGNNLDGYIGVLQALPPSNMFSSTEHVKIIQMVEERRTRSEEASTSVMAKTMTLGAIAVGGTAGLVLLFASSGFLRRRSNQKSDRSIFGNQSSSTIAGETFATRASRQDNRIFQPICDKLYDDAIESRR